jgi:glutathione S-transferase
MARPLLVIGDKNFSSWSLRAWLAMCKSGVSFDEELIPLDTEEFEERIQRYSPTRRVPVLHDHGQVLWDSLAICEYVNEAYADGALWPKDPRARAVARAISAEMHAGFEALRDQMSMNWKAPPHQVPSTAALEGDIQRVRTIWSESLARGHTGPWLFGQFSIADAMYAPVVLRFHTYEVPVGAPEAAYMGAVLGDEHVSQWLRAAEREPARD